MTTPTVIRRQAYRRTDDFTPGTPKLKLVEEALPLPLDPTAALIRVHAVSLNYRDANIANGGNPWPVTPHGIICNDAAGTVLAVGDKAKALSPGDRVAPITDTENITGREPSRSWLAADEDGVLADHLVFDESALVRLPAYLDPDPVAASVIPCAGTTAWSALKGAAVGNTVLIQGTGGVAMFALKLARASGLRVILSSSSDQKLARIKARFSSAPAPRGPPLLTVNYAADPDWHLRVLQLTAGAGVDLVLENGGTSSLVKSVMCTRRGGVVSQVGYLGKQDPSQLAELIPTLIDRRVNLRGINAGSKHDMQDLCAALEANQLPLDDIIDSVYPFDKAEEAVEHVWQGRQVGKLVIQLPDKHEPRT